MHHYPFCVHSEKGRRTHRIKGELAVDVVMKAQGIPDFQAPPSIPKFIDTVEAIDELPSYDSFEPAPDEF